MVNKEKKFYQKTRLERLDFLSQTEKISSESKQLFTDNTLLANDVADSLIENQITQFHLPQGVALNFTIDGI